MGANLNTYYPAIINVGHNPSFNYTLKTSIEAHIFDFNQDLYDTIMMQTVPLTLYLWRSV